MFTANLVEHIARRTRSSVGYIIQTLANSCFRVRASGNI